MQDSAGRRQVTALWVEKGAELHLFPWLEASFAAHDEARSSGLTYERFAAMPVKTVDAITSTSSSKGPKLLQRTSEALRKRSGHRHLASPVFVTTATCSRAWQTAASCQAEHPHDADHALIARLHRLARLSRPR